MVFPIGRCAERVLAAIETKLRHARLVSFFLPEKGLQSGLNTCRMILLFAWLAFGPN